MGDGALVEFASVVDAVRCAVLIQRGMAGREAELPGAERVRSVIGLAFVAMLTLLPLPGRPRGDRVLLPV